MRIPVLKNMDDSGSAMIIALIMLVVLTILGISATTTTEIETQIAGNQKFHKMAFYNTDSGVYSTPKLIRVCAEDEDGNQPALTNVSYLVGGTNNFLRQVMGYDTYDSGVSDIQYSLGGNNVRLDVNRNRQVSLAGGGVEFATGAEGVGTGSAGGVAIIYRMDSMGFGPSNSRARIEAEYRYLPGVSGGL